jgi:hypothetical protein
MRRFSSYGPVDTQEHYYAPRKKLIEKTYTQLVGHNPGKGGYYFTVWAPRQTGKTWLMQQILFQLRNEERFDVLKINLEHLKEEEDVSEVLSVIAKEIGEGLSKDLGGIRTRSQFQEIFKRGVLEKPLILILDEFDALEEQCINAVVSAFRNVYIKRVDESDKPAGEKTYLLHAVALIGVRSVLGVENAKGSPFNVQRSLHIPNLSREEVAGIFQWYEKESGHSVDDDVIERVYYETRGQPGLTCWLGELLTEGFEDYKVDRSRPIGITEFEKVYSAAIYVLPNNNIINIVSKAKEEANQLFILDMFKTGEKMDFTFDDPVINSLYLNGVVDRDKEEDGRYYLRFSSSFVQKRLFNYFSRTLFKHLGNLVQPFLSLDNVITDTRLNIPNLLKLYQAYIEKNKDWLFESAPRRSDMRIFEAVYHFNLYSYLDAFLKEPGGRVYPEFPTGNGKIDLIVTYKNHHYGMELKSFTNERNYRDALTKAAKYGKQLELAEIYLVCFVEYIDDETRKKYEASYREQDTGVTVLPIFIATGN